MGDPAEAVGNTDNDTGKGAGTSGYVFLKSGFLVRLQRERLSDRLSGRYSRLSPQGRLHCSTDSPSLRAHRLSTSFMNSKREGRSSHTDGRSGTLSSSDSRTENTPCSTSRIRSRARTRTGNSGLWICPQFQTYASDFPLFLRASTFASARTHPYT